MQTLFTKFAATASIAALICASPVSIDLVRAGAADASGTSTTRLALTMDSAQAHPAHGGGRQAAGRDGEHQVAGRGEHRTANNARAENARGWDGRANNERADNIRANNVRADDARVNNARVNNARINNADVNNVRVNDVNVNNVDATRINGTYVRPPYVAPRAAAIAAGTAVAVGTTVAVLPPSCAVVVYDGVTYHNCGGSYYVASDGAYVAVNPPR